VTDWKAAMADAITLAQDPSAPRGENPRVGCVVVDARGEIVGRGFHRGAGTAHAEVVALAEAGDRARGATAVVTLEPCNHTGRTGPCSQALLDAGITRVVYAQPDPTAKATGGAYRLAEGGVDVIAGVGEGEAIAINREWTIAVSRNYPFVTAKCAVSLDGRVAGAGGRRVQLTGRDANIYAHALRARVGAVVVGTGTVLADDPELTVRNVPLLAAGPPRRIVVGDRAIPGTMKIMDNAAPTTLVQGHDPLGVLHRLYREGVRDVLVESGPTLLAAFLRAGLVDELVWFIAGVWLGSGPHALPGDSPLNEQVTVVESRALGQDVLLRATPVRKAA
jgi:diaminohydroxyphosphoribosylaminopyrimidine deaminase/5-amino-6-(5-phosphoribosylamino)uracil reductase